MNWENYNNYPLPGSLSSYLPISFVPFFFPSSKSELEIIMSYKVSILEACFTCVVCIVQLGNAFFYRPCKWGLRRNEFFVDLPYQTLSLLCMIVRVMLVEELLKLIIWSPTEAFLYSCVVYRACLFSLISNSFTSNNFKSLLFDCLCNK